MEITDRKIPKRKGAIKYPFAQLQRGQCLEVPIEDPEDVGRLRSAASHYGKQYSVTLTVRKITETLYGVWRVK